ncbi:hypothetical protein Tco_1284994 [Tanacetum coccineum]
MESSNSNSKERELQLTQRLAKQRHSHCMAWLEQLETHLRDLYLNSSSHVVDAFKPTFRVKMFHNLDLLRLQLERDSLLEVNPRTCLEALRTQFKEFFTSNRINSSEHLNQCWQKDFEEYTLCEPNTYRRDLLETLDTLEAVIHRAVITYGKLQLQSQDVQINPVQAVDVSLVTESTTLEANLATDVKALDVGSVITESSGTKSDKHDTSSSSGTYITHAVDANIRPYTEQSEPIYDTHLLEKVDNNTTPDSTNMCHRGGEIDQDAEQYQAKSPLLKAEFLKTNDMVEKEVYNELSNRFLQLEKHCISLEISIQQKEENFQSNKPCKNQDAPEFCEFFEINDLKAQLQAKTILICNLKNQIKSVKEASNEVKVKHDIDVLETINIELESSVAKLLAENENLNKENEHLKQTYKELYDSIKKTRIQTKDHNDSLIAQVNSKTVENADLKAQIQEKVFANVALKNELRKLKGNSMDTKFAKPSILGKPVLQPPRNQSVVRQPNAFKSERPNFSKPRFASQVDVNNVLSKPVTPHYLPKVREYVLAKPYHVIAPGSSRISQEELYGSNDMAHNHYLEEARKKTQERNRNSKPSTTYLSAVQGLAFNKQSNSAAESSGPSQRKEMEYASVRYLSKNEKSSYLRPVLSTTSISCSRLLLVVAAQDPVASTSTPSSVTIDQDASSTSCNAKLVSGNAKNAGRRIRRVMVVSLHSITKLIFEGVESVEKRGTHSLLNAACKKAVNLLKKGLMIRGKLWKLLNEEEACLTTKFNNFPKVQVKDLVLLQRFPMTQRTIMVAQAAYFIKSIKEVHDVSNDEENKSENTKRKQ